MSGYYFSVVSTTGDCGGSGSRKKRSERKQVTMDMTLMRKVTYAPPLVNFKDMDSPPVNVTMTGEKYMTKQNSYMIKCSSHKLVVARCFPVADGRWF